MTQNSAHGNSRPRLRHTTLGRAIALFSIFCVSACTSSPATTTAGVSNAGDSIAAPGASTVAGIATSGSASSVPTQAAPS